MKQRRMGIPSFLPLPTFIPSLENSQSECLPGAHNKYTKEKERKHKRKERKLVAGAERFSYQSVPSAVTIIHFIRSPFFVHGTTIKFTHEHFPFSLSPCHR